MADLSALIRLHKHTLDQKRAALAQLQMALAALEHERRMLEEEFIREKQAANEDGDVSFTFPAYADAVKKRHQAFDEREAELLAEIETAKESMMETFSELKKFEMTQAERDRLEQEERRLKENRLMDEIGLESFRRKSDDNF